MDDRDFVDLLYQGWSKTTGAENTFWMPELENGTYLYRIYAVGAEGLEDLIAEGLTEDDAAFITALHGCFGDLVRRMHEALDEADRLDKAADDRENMIAGLAIESDERAAEIERLQVQLDHLRGEK